ncbi:MAG: hypothetical protein H6905_06675 [Hyphomicrobiales bacterium]|nr:hypothetical protein [Hyphomicrobiales bacterium]
MLSIANIGTVNRGSKGITKVMLGSVLVWQETGGGASTPSLVNVTKKVNASNPITSDAVSHTQTAGNKLLVIAVGMVRASIAETATITYAGASADVEATEGQGAGNGMHRIAYALFNTPASGANTVSVTWSGGLRNTIIYAIDLANAGDILATGNDGGGWSRDVGHSINIEVPNSLLILAAAARDTVAMTIPFSAGGMIVSEEDETEEATTSASLAALAYEQDPPTGTQAIEASFAGADSDYSFGLSLVIGAA